MEGFCRDCLRLVGEALRCPHCGSTRVLAHPELQTLSIAHLDCDAFYAAIEKRDAPELHNKPVIVSERGGMPEIVLNGITGFIFNPDDPQSLDNLIADIKTRSIEKEKFTEGINRIKKQFDCLSIAKQYIRTYEGI